MNDETLRQAFKYFNRFMLLMWQLGLGPWLSFWPEVGGQFMVITHTGRKSGRIYRTPVNYVIVDGEVYCAAGFGSLSDWYRNIIANPQVEIWIKDGWWTGKAEEINSPEQRLSLMRAVIVASGFAGPLFGVEPDKLDDQQLEEITKSYRLIHIHRREARTGPGGPGEFAWVWPLVTFLLLPLAFRRKRR